MVVWENHNSSVVILVAVTGQRADVVHVRCLKHCVTMSIKIYIGFVDHDQVSRSLENVKVTKSKAIFFLF